MKKIIKSVRILSIVGFMLCVYVWSLILTLYNDTTSSYNIQRGNALEVSALIETSDLGKNSQNEKDVELSLFGLFPVRTVKVTANERQRVVPGGIPFGIKILSDGVMIIAVSGVNSDGKIVCPAREAGLKVGDIIKSINGVEVSSNNDVVGIVSKSKQETMRFLVERENGKTEQINLNAVLDKNDMCYKIGVWVRDSSAGIGTVTYFNPETKCFGGLGHPVCDSDTGEIISLNKGNVVIAKIDSVTKGKNGTPGQLNGHFLTSQNSGEILKNDITGVYGTLKNVTTDNKTVEIAYKQEVKCGKATILTTLDGVTPKEYEVEIEKIAMGEGRKTKNMLIRVTDKELLNLAGGIVQGMSGSPIMQNGRLVGAVTHVLVDDSTRGYGIFIENMLETAQSVAENNEFQDAS